MVFGFRTYHQPPASCGPSSSSFCFVFLLYLYCIYILLLLFLCCIFIEFVLYLYHQPPATCGPSSFSLILYLYFISTVFQIQYLFLISTVFALHVYCICIVFYCFCIVFLLNLYCICTVRHQHHVAPPPHPFLPARISFSPSLYLYFWLFTLYLYSLLLLWYAHTNIIDTLLLLFCPGIKVLFFMTANNCSQMYLLHVYIIC